ncbi:hypothetical protein [[Phormidium] sp. ETS-05]|uniref:hypothetical protein n=1 Tax=[Phormidium] sp. ETS-05 TaxID=222819 RepID=UPI001E2C783B|nr:hypothetical protein [[Phormidium] sp. ETS-05]
MTKSGQHLLLTNTKKCHSLHFARPEQLDIICAPVATGLPTAGAPAQRKQLYQWLIAPLRMTSKTWAWTPSCFLWMRVCGLYLSRLHDGSNSWWRNTAWL